MFHSQPSRSVTRAYSQLINSSMNNAYEWSRWGVVYKIKVSGVQCGFRTLLLLLYRQKKKRSHAGLI